VTNIFQILIKETAGQTRVTALIQCGVPFPKGLFFNHRELRVIADDGSVLDSNISTTVLWPDNSIKWCLVKTNVKLSANNSLKLKIDKYSEKYDSTQCSSGFVFETEKEIKVKSKSCLFELNKKYFNFFDKVISHNKSLVENGYCALKTKQYGLLEPEISSYHYHTSSTSSGCPLLSELTMDGIFQSAAGELIANFETKLTFYTGTDMVRCDFMLHNPKPAKHTAGLWDLGDPNSLIFSSFDLGITINDIKAINWKTDKNQPWNSLEQQPLTIFQESSGGQNWNSPNHKNSSNKVPYTLNGFECKNHNTVLHSGKRASPCLRINTNAGQLGVFIENFWQNCPKSLGIQNNQINIGLFPAQFSNEFELQPGEKKTHSFYLDFSREQDALNSIENPIDITLNPAWIMKSGVFQYFDINFSDDPLHKIIKEGLTGDNNFIAKREIIDEYGWRNFGDLYADHETDGYDGDDIFISHYNNQYDPIYGFLRQYAITGDYKWFELANDLAHHVVDIDIYHTKHDKNEYNGGLFWHTDHYLDAATSSHRSFSKFQKSHAYIDHLGGGGPGGQHCYTTGLLYHFLITGEPSSKNAVLQLANWITNVYEGSETLLDVLLSIKNRNRIGYKNISTGKYPLDRGTGNYINTLLDIFVLTQQQNTLYQIEHIIKNTVHPLDDLKDRDLGNAEIRWFYTVFLQSVCRYLQTKEELSALDGAFYYARDSLLHYADWILENEYPYLEKPEILEFPNHTWTAQDIRKVNILLFASYYSPSTSFASAYSAKAQKLYNYITDNLSSEKTRTYTRILTILMQNHGAIAYFSNLNKAAKFEAIRRYTPLKKRNQLKAIRNITAAFYNAIKHFSPQQELLWLSHRSEKITKLYRFRR
jgi:hypothetical protein